MTRMLGPFLNRLSVARRFQLVSLVVMLLGFFGIGAWLQWQISAGIVQGTAETAAIYVASLSASALQGLTSGAPLSSEAVAMLDRRFRNSALSQQLAAFKVWGPNGVVLYDTDHGNIGRVYPVEDRLARAWRGETVARISNLDSEENVTERPLASSLLETYSPLYGDNQNGVIGVAEFYQRVDDLRHDIAVAQRSSWAVVGAAMAVIYVVLFRFVQRASDLISEQQTRLSDDVVRLQELLGQNRTLAERERHASGRLTDISERYLRRISAELHDGPAQDLGMALLWFDPGGPLGDTPADGGAAVLAVGANARVRQALHRALKEVRAISSGLGIPELDRLSLSETIERAVKSHEERTDTCVNLTMGDLPGESAEPTKLVCYRLVQEALTNAYRHGAGIGQAVDAHVDGRFLVLCISDEGPGFDPAAIIDRSKHLGIAGMRERVQAEGGLFEIESAIDRGTRIAARFPLTTAAEARSA